MLTLKRSRAVQLVAVALLTLTCTVPFAAESTAQPVLQTVKIPLKYVDASTVAEMFSPTEPNPLLLPEGMTDPPRADVRGNSLIVKGTPKAIAELTELLAQLDLPGKDVEVRVQFLAAAPEALDALKVGLDRRPWGSGKPAEQGQVGIAWLQPSSDAATDLARVTGDQSFRELSEVRLTAANMLPPEPIPLPLTAFVKGLARDYLTIPGAKDADRIDLGIAVRVNADDTIWVAPTLAESRNFHSVLSTAPVRLRLPAVTAPNFGMILLRGILLNAPDGHVEEMLIAITPRIVRQGPGTPMPPTGKAPAAIRATAVLLSGRVEFAGDQIRWAGGGTQSVRTTADGARTVEDTSTDVIMIVNPDATTTALFADPQPPTGPVLARQEATLKAGEEHAFDFPWPPDRPQYYLEKMEGDLYRRVEVAEKEGFAVKVTHTDQPRAPAAVEFEKRSLVGAKYDETIRAFVGQPVLGARKTMTNWPVAEGKPTMVLWLPQPSQQAAPEAANVPYWAVGVWDVSGPSTGTGVLTVRSDGTVTWIEKGAGKPQSGSVDATGGVQFGYRPPAPQSDDDVIQARGQLTEEGVASGTWEAGVPGGATMEFGWMASRRVGPHYPTAAPGHPGPSGVAVLLEVVPEREAAG